MTPPSPRFPATRADALVTAERLRVYPLILLAAYAVAAVGWVLMSADGIDPGGKPLGYDFITFYAAAVLALEGRAVEAFSPATILAAQQAAVPANRMLFLWHYPPTFHLVVTPLGLLPYGLAFLAFAILNVGALLALVRHVADHRLALLLAIAFPALFINTFHGQNGALNAALFGFGLLLLERRPILAGVLIGLLAYKPHLGLLIPFALAAAGYWRSFGAAAATVLAFCGLATLAFGWDYWRVFLANLSLTSQVLEAGALPWAKMPTLFAAASLLGAPTALAYALQAAIALPACALAIWAWRRPGPLDLKVALLAVAALTPSPYLFDYDLALLAIPCAILARHALAGGDGRAGAAFLVGIATLPVVGPGLAQATSLQIMPMGIAALFAACWIVLASARERMPSHPLVSDGCAAARSP
jgi:hypothetical protein